MKANEAPEKIYLDDSLSTDTVGEWWSNALWFDTIVSDDSIEYTRTDAFIEKAVSFIRNCTTYDGLGYKAKCVDIEEFIKAMKL